MLPYKTGARAIRFRAFVISCVLVAHSHTIFKTGSRTLPTLVQQVASIMSQDRLITLGKSFISCLSQKQVFLLDKNEAKHGEGQE